MFLCKYNDSFHNREIIKLSELFYTSLGARSVDINQFLEALDAVVVEHGMNGDGDTEKRESEPIGSEGNV